MYVVVSLPFQSILSELSRYEAAMSDVRICVGGLRGRVVKTHSTRSLTNRQRRFESCSYKSDCVRKFVCLLAEGQCIMYVSGFSFPPIKTDRHHMTERLLIMAKNAK
jgi:hypothetical protein